VKHIVRIFKWLFVLMPAHIQLCVGLRKIQNRFEWMGLRRGWKWSDANAAADLRRKENDGHEEKRG